MRCSVVRHAGGGRRARAAAASAADSSHASLPCRNCHPQPHLDAFNDAANQRRELGGQRVLTFLMYLAPPEEGGETVFVDAERRVSGPGWSECALQGLAHKPAKGDALMWYSLRPDGQVDTHSIHGSCPTLKGECKSSCAQFMFQFRSAVRTARPQFLPRTVNTSDLAC